MKSVWDGVTHDQAFQSGYESGRWGVKEELESIQRAWVSAEKEVGRLTAELAAERRWIENAAEINRDLRRRLEERERDIARVTGERDVLRAALLRRDNR